MAPATSHNDGKIVLVTGINGYIAATLGLTLLQHGYTVRGTSRNPEDEIVLRSGPYKAFPESQFQYVHVPDIMAPGAFDAAVVGCTAIFPLASPVGEADSKGLDGFMRPAIMSATSVLHSAHNHAGPQLECVVYMSSVAGVFDFGKCIADPTYAFSENDWNEFSERMARQVGDENAPRYLLYPASKVAAEKAVWKFRDERKPSFALTSILPGYVSGPPDFLPASTTSDPSSVTFCLRPLFTYLTNPGGDTQLQTGDPTTDMAAGPWVDLRDVCDMFLFCLQHPHQVDGERFLACAGMTCSPIMAEILKQAYPGRDIPTLAEGEEEEKKKKAFVKTANGWTDGVNSFKSEKAERIMGIKWRPFKDAVIDTAKVFVESGF